MSCWCACKALAVLIALALFVVGMVYAFKHEASLRGPKYSVTVTGVAGLDPTRDLLNDGRLSPVFNLTFALKSLVRKPVMSECAGGTQVLVSYGDALLGKAAAPHFCVEPQQEDEQATTAWGMNVDMPRFLRDRLAAELQRCEAVLDINVLEAYTWSYDARLCKVKIGGGLCRC